MYSQGGPVYPERAARGELGPADARGLGVKMVRDKVVPNPGYVRFHFPVTPTQAILPIPRSSSS